MRPKQLNSHAFGGGEPVGVFLGRHILYIFQSGGPFIGSVPLPVTVGEQYAIITNVR